MSSPAVGDNIVTAVRATEDGILLFVVNGNDWERKVMLDLTPYKDGAPIARYVAGAKGIRVEPLPDSGSESSTSRCGRSGFLYLR